MGVVKKCCFCCHNLATLIKERVGLEFVLQGTHSTILPWVPPRGIPLDVLVELRMTLLRALYNTVKEAVDTLLFTQTSPADSISPVTAYELYLSELPVLMIRRLPQTMFQTRTNRRRQCQSQTRVLILYHRRKTCSPVPHFIPTSV